MTRCSSSLLQRNGDLPKRLLPLFINDKEHFVLVVVDLAPKRITFYDSCADSLGKRYESEAAMIAEALGSTVSDADDSGGFRAFMAHLYPGRIALIRVLVVVFSNT